MPIQFHKRACLVLPVTGPLRKAVSEAAASTHRAGPGVRMDEDPHVTIRYGIRNEEDASTLRAIRKIMRDTPSFGLQFGELKTFEPSKSSDGAYPLVIRCEQSDELLSLFKKVSRQVPCDPFTFESYSPHITLAYLPSGRIPQATVESVRQMQGMHFPVFRADLWFRDGRRVVFPVGTAVERLDSPYSAFTAPNRGSGPQPVGESQEGAFTGLENGVVRSFHPVDSTHAVIEGVNGDLYLLHYDKALHHAQHYLGWAKDSKARLARHAAGKSGASLPRAFHAMGSKPTMVRSWKNKDRDFERKLKNHNNGRRLCPVCNPTSAHTHGV